MAVSFQIMHSRNAREGGRELGTNVPSKEVRRLPEVAEIIFWPAVISSSPLAP